MSELRTKRRVLFMAAGAVVLAAMFVGLTGMIGTSSSESTNDAFVTADFTVVSPRVAGQISVLSVDDNQTVSKGQLIAQIDDRDYVAAVASAQADVSIAEASIDNVSTSIAQQQSLIDQAGATLSASRASDAFAKADLDRYTDLARHGAGSTQNAQQARSRVDVSKADVARNEAGLKATRQQIAILQSQKARAQGTLEHARAALQTAQLNLSYTRIVAPIDGVVGQRAVRVGAYVTPGSPLLAVVPLQQAYVIANFQETQLTDVRRGQPADVRIDTYPGLVLHGKVDSIAPATGATFAAIAPDNATGNFTKVVQRIPVKIVLDPRQDAFDPLRAGMSVEAEIRTDSPVHAAAEHTQAAR